MVQQKQKDASRKTTKKRKRRGINAHQVPKRPRPIIITIIMLLHYRICTSVVFEHDLVHGAITIRQLTLLGMIKKSRSFVSLMLEDDPTAPFFTGFGCLHCSCRCCCCHHHYLDNYHNVPVVVLIVLIVLVIVVVVYRQMVDFHESSQLCSWTYTSPVHLTWLRGKANYLARQQLAIADANTAGQHGGVEKNKSAEDNHNDDRKNNTNNNNNNGGGNTVEDGNGAVTDTTKTITAAVLSSGLPNPTQAKFFARGWTKRFRSGRDDGETTAEDEEYQRYETSGPRENGEGRSFLTSAEETCLVSFYAPKIGKMIGPRAVLPRLKRNSKVTATAALLYRRFFLSNSVMMYDPKAVMVASAFLASKVR